MPQTENIHCNNILQVYDQSSATAHLFPYPSSFGPFQGTIVFSTSIATDSGCVVFFHDNFLTPCRLMAIFNLMVLQPFQLRKNNISNIEAGQIFFRPIFTFF